MEKVRAYFSESYQELVNKTSWPSWADLQKTSLLVAVASVIIALIIAAMDWVITQALDAFYNIF